MTHPTESLRSGRRTNSAGPRNTRIVLAGLALAGLLAGCASVVDGSGTTDLTAGPSGASSSPDFPTPTAGGSVPAGPPAASPTATPAAPTACPHVAYPAAKLSFDCLSPGMTESGADPVWPLALYKTVEPSTGWTYDEGAGHWGATEGRSLTSIAQNVRQQMVDNPDYGTSPKLTTVASKDIDVDTATGHLLQTMVTIDPTYAKVHGTNVKREQLWIVAIKIGTDDVSLWYVSIPDLAKSLWPKVPALINGIRVG